MKLAARLEIAARLDVIGNFTEPLTFRLLHKPVQTVRCNLFSRLSRVLSRARLDFGVGTRTVFGRRLRVPVAACWEIVAARTYLDRPERRLIRFMLSHVEEGGCVIDAGANVGFFSLLAAELVGDRGYVAAFEPSRIPLKYLHENAAAVPQVHVVEAALSDFDGEITLYQGSGNAMVSSTTVLDHLSRRGAADTVSGDVVPAMTLDGFSVARGLEPDLIKIDVEGAELAVLKGARRLLRRVRPAVVLEVGFADHDHGGLEAVAFLLGMGYRCHAIRRDGTLAAIGLDGMEAHAEKTKASKASYHNLDNMVFLHESRIH